MCKVFVAVLDFGFNSVITGFRNQEDSGAGHER